MNLHYLSLRVGIKGAPFPTLLNRFKMRGVRGSLGPLPSLPCFLLLCLACLTLSVCSIEVVQRADLDSFSQIDNLLPSFYKPDTDEICFRNGVRYTSCSPDAGRLVQLSSTERSALFHMLRSPTHGAKKFRNAVYVMLIQLEKRLKDKPKEAGSGQRLKDMVETHMASTAGPKNNHDKGDGLEMMESDMDPSIEGAPIAERLGAPPVTHDESKCYSHWLKEKRYGWNETNTILNELYVRHVSVTQGQRKRWDIVSPIDCYRNPGMVSDLVKDETFNDARRKLMEQDKPSYRSDASGGNLGRSLLFLPKRGLTDEADFDGRVQDHMTVYHPIMGNHLEDPWEDNGCREEHKTVLSGGGIGSWKKRSIGGGNYWVGHRHTKRGKKKQGKESTSASTPPGVGADYNSGIPSAPVQQDGGIGAAGSGASMPSGSASAITNKPHGFAAGVTGGGSAPPVVPQNIHELEKLLTDASPRVIHLNRVYDFRGSAGICTNCKGCIPDTYAKCPSKGQLAIDNGQGWCNGRPAHAVTYDKAGLTSIRIGSNKTIIGITPDAGIRGKGLLVAHQKNVIMHNFRIDEINPAFIWGGDGVTLRDTDLVWIDKITFSMIGRQFIVTGYQSAGRVTISNCFFDCQTKWSATCDDSHYWTVLGYGRGDQVTFSGNLMKHCSGRSPRIASPDSKASGTTWHVVNTVFKLNTGHALDMDPYISALIEGNVFTDVAQTCLHEATPGRAFAPSDKSVCTQCQGQLGRDCQPNAYTNAKPVPSTMSPGQVLKDIAKEAMVDALPPAQVAMRIGKTAGCEGKGEEANADAGTGAGSVVGDVGGIGMGVGLTQENYGDGSARYGGTNTGPSAAGGGGARAYGGEAGAADPDKEAKKGDSPDVKDAANPNTPAATASQPFGDGDGDGGSSYGAKKAGYGSGQSDMQKQIQQQQQEHGQSNSDNPERCRHRLLEPDRPSGPETDLVEPDAGYRSD